MKRKELILEIGCEELPASFIEPALSYLKEELTKGLDGELLKPSGVETFGTPRRLIVLAYDVPEKQPDRKEILIGPSLQAAFKDGEPTKAAIGFARSKGVDVKKLIIVENPKGKKGKYVAVEKLIEGRETLEVLKELLPKVITSIPFKKSMRWGNKKVRFGRPIRWILALYGEEVVPFEIDGIRSSNFSYGHRFLSPEPFTVREPSQLLEELKERFVVPSLEERRGIIVDGAVSLSKRVEGKLIKDEELLEEVVNLTEFPYPILGSFEEEFLSLPKEVVITVMKEHQKFFSISDDKGKLKNYFVGVANIKPVREEVVREGYEKVLRARLKDALFFFNEDRKVKLEDRVPKLKGVVFHDKLGTMFDKTLRLTELSPFISLELSFKKEEEVKRAAYLCKADLLTEMVNEFPELQGVMGKYYALFDGETQEVAEAIEEHYLPRFSGDKVPKTQTGTALALSEKIDNLIGFIGIGLKPTGSADPFALRRNALGLIQVLLKGKLFLNLQEALEKGAELYKKQGINLNNQAVEEALGFILDRLKGVLKEKGFKADTVEAVLGATNDPYDALLRATAVEKLRLNPEFEEVLITMRRVVNIIPEGFEAKEFKPEGEYERELYEKFLQVKEKISEKLKERDYEGALLLVKELKPKVDAFFDNVMVMDKDEKVRNRRLSLLKEIEKELSKLLDFSKLAF